MQRGVRREWYAEKNICREWYAESGMQRDVAEKDM